MSRRRSTWLRALALAVVVCAPAAARAREEFPYAIAVTLEGSNPQYVPPCSVCHLGGKIGGTTVFTPFAWAMRLRGLGGQGSSVETAILRVRDDGVDSDGDGMGDAEEISVGRDPNNAGTAVDLQDPKLGCQVGGPTPVGTFSAAISIAVAALVRRRRR